VKVPLSLSSAGVICFFASTAMGDSSNNDTASTQYPALAIAFNNRQDSYHAMHPNADQAAELALLKCQQQSANYATGCTVKNVFEASTPLCISYGQHTYMHVELDKAPVLRRNYDVIKTDQFIRNIRDNPAYLSCLETAESLSYPLYCDKTEFHSVCNFE